MPIPALPTAPSRDRPSTFASEADAFLTALDPWADAVDVTAAQVAANAVLAAASASAISLPDYTDTSTTSLTIGTGTKVFTASAGKLWGAGMPIIARNGSNFMRGTVTSYVGTTLTVSIDTVNGSGTFASWTLALYLAPTGARGGGADALFWENDKNMTTSYTLSAGKNALMAGPLVIANGAVLTIPSGQRLVVM